MHFGELHKKSEDDEVVASFGVYVSPSLAEQVHVIEYPLRNRDRPYEAKEVKMFCSDGISSTASNSPKEKAVITPSSRLTMRCSLDVFGSPNFRPDDGNTLSPEECSRDTFSYTLQSKPFVTRSDYAAAYFTGSEVHLVPVSSVQQMLPALDSTGAKEMTKTGAVRVSSEHTSVQTGPVVPGLSASDRVQRELLRQRSVVLNADADSAKEMQYYPPDSAESQSLRRQLLCVTKEPVTGLTTLAHSGTQVQNALFPPEILSSGGITGGTDTSSTIIRSFASLSSIAAQVAQLMQRCQVLSLSVLAENVVKPGNRLNSASDSLFPELVDALRACAVYMHGVWVSRTCDEFKGVAAALREVVLLQFSGSSNGSLQRSQLNKLVTSSALRQSIKDILCTIAVLNQEEPDPTKRRWTLQYVPTEPSAYQETKEANASKFGTEISAQHAAWGKRTPLIMSHLSYVNIMRIPPALALPGRNDSTRSTAYGASNPPAVSVVSFANNSSSSSAVAAPSEIRDADLAPIRQYIRMLFAEHGVLNKLRAKEMVLKGRESNYPRATNQMLSAALQSSVRPFTESTWILKTLGDPAVDKYRPTILEALLELKVFEMRAAQRRVGEVLSQHREFSQQGESTTEEKPAVPETVLRRVISEVADYKSGEKLWHLKGGNAAAD